jgi:acyl-CoA reductase-like NAD-dependent aldehyde dehydrogenase
MPTPHLDSLVARNLALLSNVAPRHKEMTSEFMDLVHLMAQYELSDPHETHQRDHTRLLQDIADELQRHRAQSTTAAIENNKKSIQEAREEQLRRFLAQ